MSLLDIVWHMANWLAPVLGLGLLAPALTKVVWSQRLRSTSYWRLATWSLGAAVLGFVVNLLLLDRDGQMLGYATLVLTTSTALWWVAFGRAAIGKR